MEKLKILNPKFQPAGKLEHAIVGARPATVVNQYNCVLFNVGYALVYRFTDNLFIIVLLACKCVAKYIKYCHSWLEF